MLIDFTQQNSNLYAVNAAPLPALMGRLLPWGAGKCTDRSWDEAYSLVSMGNTASNGKENTRVRGRVYY
jgi:hypothetical protein